MAIWTWHEINTTFHSINGQCGPASELCTLSISTSVSSLSNMQDNSFPITAPLQPVTSETQCCLLLALLLICCNKSLLKALRMLILGRCDPLLQAAVTDYATALPHELSGGASEETMWTFPFFSFPAAHTHPRAHTHILSRSLCRHEHTPAHSQHVNSTSQCCDGR